MLGAFAKPLRQLYQFYSAPTKSESVVRAVVAPAVAAIVASYAGSGRGAAEDMYAAVSALSTRRRSTLRATAWRCWTSVSRDR